MNLSAIVMDTSIQCRAKIDTERVDEYAKFYALAASKSRSAAQKKTK